jgi:hypothetical protein
MAEPEVSAAEDTQSKTETTNESSQDSPWWQQLPEDVRSEKLWSRYKNPEEAWRAHVNLSKLQGQSIRLPKDDASPEEWMQIYEKLGRPTNPEEYKIDVPKGLPAEIKFNEAEQADFVKIAHQLGLNQRQVAALAEWDLKRHVARLDGMKSGLGQEQAKVWQELKDSWGPLFDRNRGLAIEAFERYADSEDADAFDEKYGNDPIALRFLARIGETLVEKGEITGASSAMMTAESAQAELDKIQSERIKNPKHPLNNPNDPAHDQAIQSRRQLYAIVAQARGR